MGLGGTEIAMLVSQIIIIVFYGIFTKLDFEADPQGAFTDDVAATMNKRYPYF